MKYLRFPGDPLTVRTQVALVINNYCMQYTLLNVLTLKYQVIQVKENLVSSLGEGSVVRTEKK